MISGHRAASSGQNPVHSPAHSVTPTPTPTWTPRTRSREAKQRTSTYHRSCCRRITALIVGYVHGGDRGAHGTGRDGETRSGCRLVKTRQTCGGEGPQEMSNGRQRGRSPVTDGGGHSLAIAHWWNQERLRATDADSEEGAGAAVEAELAVIEDALGLSERATKFWTRYSFTCLSEQRCVSLYLVHSAPSHSSVFPDCAGAATSRKGLPVVREAKRDPGRDRDATAKPARCR
ncbi:hypothetical protein B0H14DRAFT_66867 [Mycena olivaceomarginata]|nr:hypothetical protein B0H14DRAFT_66867 [Mycena olivaceomarginata]